MSDQWAERLNTRQQMEMWDLGHRDDLYGLGPTGQEEARAFRDADEPRYIDPRPPQGIHCMDDNVEVPGVQVPGGWLITRIAGRMMNRRKRALPLRKAYRQELAEIVRVDPRAVVMHGIVCAAGAFQREGLRAAADDVPGAVKFGGEVMEAMKLWTSDRAIEEAVYTGRERADDDRLWNISFHTGLAIARRNVNVVYEEYVGHTVAGLRFDTTPHRFNNALFRQEHKVGSKPVGVLNVSAGAFKDYLVETGFEDADVAREVLHASLFTYGLAKAKTHPFGETGIVFPLDD